MCDEAANNFLPTLNSVPYFAYIPISKMIKKVFTALYADENIV